jgi:hypothetical protein
MPFITAEQLLEDFIGPNVNTGDLGLPEAPDNWGHEGGGYINDSTDLEDSAGGLRNDYGINQILPWFVAMAEKTFDVTGRNERVQFRFPRHYMRLKNAGWSFVSTTDNPRANYDYRFPGNVESAINHAVRTVTMSSGGVAQSLILDWCLHPFPTSKALPNLDLQDCWGGHVQMRLVPIDETAVFSPDDFRVSGNYGSDNYKSPNSFEGEHTHGRFKRITRRWQAFGAATVRRPNGHPGVDNKPTQGPGLTVEQYLTSPLPLPPEESVWLERGAFNAGTNKQTLVIKRSAPVSANKTFSISVKRGTVTVAVSQVTMSAGQADVAFDVNTPGGAIAGSNTVYVTDGGIEDDWFPFEIGSGSSTGGPGGGVTPSGDDTTRTQRLLRSGDLAHADWLKGGGSVGSADGDGWQLLTNGTDYLRQVVTGLNASEPATVSIDAKPGSNGFALIRQVSSDFANGCHVFVNLTTGAVGTQTTHGTVSGLTVTTESLVGGGWRIRLTLTMAATSRQIMVRAAAADGDWSTAAGGTVSLKRPQLQAGAKGTNYIPTTTAVVTRTLTAVVTTSASPTPAAAPSSAVVALEDDTGAPWDQFGPVELVSSQPSRLAVTPTDALTDADGEVAFVLAGLVAGDADLTATAGGISSTPITVTVGTASADLDAPDPPDVTVIDSDTVEVDVTGIDVGATHVIIELAQVTPGTTPLSPIEVAVGDLPAQITNLVVGAEYRFTARATDGVRVSVPSDAETATLYRLFAYFHVAPVPGGVTGVRVVAGRIPDTGLLPTEIYGFADGEAIDVSTVTYAGQEHSRITLQLTAQPAGGKIRNGDFCCMYAMKEIEANVSRLATHVSYAGVIVEGP